MLGPSGKTINCFADGPAKIGQFAALVLIFGVSFATAQTPTSSVSPAPAKESALSDVAAESSLPTAETPAPSPAPHRTPKAAPAFSGARAKAPPHSPAPTPVNGGFGSMIPGIHMQASPSPATARQRKSKKSVAAGPTASPLPKKSSAAAAVNQSAPATSPIAAHAAQPASTTRVTTASVKQPEATTEQIAVHSVQPTVTTGAAVASVEPRAPAEGPITVPVRQRPGLPSTNASTPPVQAPVSVTAATASPVPVRANAPVQSPPVTTAHGNPTTAGAVWVNTETHVYHKQGSRYYGKTKTGKYMSEQEAITEGNRPAREWLPSTAK
jgi:hypothetical protein